MIIFEQEGDEDGGEVTPAGASIYIANRGLFRGGGPKYALPPSPTQKKKILIPLSEFKKKRKSVICFFALFCIVII